MVKATVEFCGAHFVEKANRKRRKYIETEFLENEEVKAWVEKVYAIRSDEGSLMENTYDELLEDARTLLNEGKRGKGKKDSLFKRIYKFWSSIKKVYINGTHATTDALSCINRPERRSNQEMEASNKFKNKQIRNICKGQKIIGEYWLCLSKRLEKRTKNRLGRIEETGKFKKVRKEKSQR